VTLPNKRMGFRAFYELARRCTGMEAKMNYQRTWTPSQASVVVSALGGSVAGLTLDTMRTRELYVLCSRLGLIEAAEQWAVDARR